MSRSRAAPQKLTAGRKLKREQKVRDWSWSSGSREKSNGWSTEGQKSQIWRNDAQKGWEERRALRGRGLWKDAETVRGKKCEETSWRVDENPLLFKEAPESVCVSGDAALRCAGQRKLRGHEPALVWIWSLLVSVAPELKEALSPSRSRAISVTDTVHLTNTIRAADLSLLTCALGTSHSVTFA